MESQYNNTQANQQQQPKHRMMSSLIHPGANSHIQHPVAITNDLSSVPQHNHLLPFIHRHSHNTEVLPSVSVSGPYNVHPMAQSAPAYQPVMMQQQQSIPSGYQYYQYVDPNSDMGYVASNINIPFVPAPAPTMVNFREDGQGGMSVMENGQRGGPAMMHVPQRAMMLEQDIKMFYHQQQEAHQLLEKNPILQMPVDQRAKVLEDDLTRMRHMKEEEVRELERSPILTKHVQERAQILQPELARWRNEKQEEMQLVRL